MATTIDQRPAQVDLIVTQGDDFARTVTVNGDRSGYTWAGSVKDRIYGTTLAALTVDDLSYHAGSDETSLVMSLTDTQTAALDVRPYVWDLHWTDGGSLKRTICAGRLTVAAQVSD